MLFFVISSIISSGNSISRWWKIGLIPALVRSIKQYLYPCMRDYFVLFLIGTAIILYESKSYITKVYAFPLAEVIGKQRGRSIDIIHFSSSNCIVFTTM